jgi:peptidoglycan/LPS O-acetylase OafA/YrhL
MSAAVNRELERRESRPRSLNFAHRSSDVAEARIPALDGLRGVAILMVLLFHFAPFGHGLPAPTALVDKVFLAIARTGWIGVDLFFVLSGFLITGILYDTKASRHYFRQFYARRVLRISPLYYGVLAIVLIIMPALFPGNSVLRDLKADSVWYWSYLYNVKVAATGFRESSALGHFWSLAVEEQFYLVWPLVVLLLNTRRLLVACLAAMATALLCRIALSVTGYVVLVNVWTLSAMDALAIGAFIAVVVRQPGGRAVMRRWARPVALLAGLPLAGLFVGESISLVPHRLLLTVGQSLIAVFFGAILILTLTSPPTSVIGKAAAQPMLRFFGKYSYALYVFHHPLLWFNPTSWLRLNFRDVPTVFGSQLPAYLLWLGMMVGLTVALAVVSWNVWEKQFLKLKRFFPYGAGDETTTTEVPALPPLVSAAV